MSIHSVLDSISDEVALKYLKAYYAPINSGSHFETLDADNNLPNRITGSDLYAITMLQTPIDRQPGVGILVHDADEISTLLSEIPDQALGELTQKDFEECLGPGSPALELWKLLTRSRPGDEKWGIGSTRASKIMARKRPHLIPIDDSVVREVAGFQRGDNEWEFWWKALSHNTALEERAESLRGAIKRSNLSTLRLFDVLLWYHGKYGQSDT